MIILLLRQSSIHARRLKLVSDCGMIAVLAGRNARSFDGMVKKIAKYLSPNVDQGG